VLAFFIVVLTFAVVAAMTLDGPPPDRCDAYVLGLVLLVGAVSAFLVACFGGGF